MTFPTPSALNLSTFTEIPIWPGVYDWFAEFWAADWDVLKPGQESWFYLDPTLYKAHWEHQPAIDEIVPRIDYWAQRKRKQGDGTLLFRRIGPYLRFFRLWHHPRLYKLGDWHQLPVGETLLGYAVLDFEEEERIANRAKQFKHLGAGEFDISKTECGATFVTRIAPADASSPYFNV